MIFLPEHLFSNWLFYIVFQHALRISVWCQFLRLRVFTKRVFKFLNAYLHLLAISVGKQKMKIIRASFHTVILKPIKRHLDAIFMLHTTSLVDLFIE